MRKDVIALKQKALHVMERAGEYGYVEGMRDARTEEAIIEELRLCGRTTLQEYCGDAGFALADQIHETVGGVY